jgi:hypothetical protein
MQQHVCAPLPPPRANCGWFTGEAFEAGAGWACVPVVPESGKMLTETLLSANPPPGATEQYQQNVRPGNHCQAMPAVRKLKRPYDTLGCVDARPAPPPVAGDRTAQFGAHAYV